MSIKKWQQRGEEKAELEEQEQQIREKLKMNKINKGFSQLSGEDLFKPITKRLDKAAKEPEPAEEPAEEPTGPNYEMDEFDRLDPFYDEFRPDAETPPPSPPAEEEGGDEEEEGGDETQETTSRKTWEAPAKTPFAPKTHESTDLGTIKQLITKHFGDTDYRVKSKKSKFQGYSVEDLIRARDEILRRRGELSHSRRKAHWMMPPGRGKWKAAV